MTKKTIILVLIFLIVINTIYWLYVSIRVFKYDKWVESIYARERLLMYRKDTLPKKGGKGQPFYKNGKLHIDWNKYLVDVDKLTTKQKEEYQKILEESHKLDKEWRRNRSGFTNKMISTFAESNLYTTPLLILAITDAVLVAISFMIILLYKKK
ncbi:hypothetical protein ES703_107082 [subsurface metagenome]